MSPPTQPSPFRVWLLATRPKTLWAGLAPVLMGTAMAVGDDVLHIGAAMAACAGALFIQIGTNFANDYFDFKKGADTQERIGPTRATQAGWVKPEAMKNATALTFALAGAVSLYLVYRGGWPVALVAIAAIASGILYTGGPYPLGYHGWGDMFVLIFFGPIATAGTYYVQALEVPPYVLLAGCAPGLLSVALLAINNLRDVQQDRSAGKRTLAVRFGPTFARAEYFFCVLMAGAIPWGLMYTYPEHRWVGLASLVIFLAVPALKTVWGRSDGPSLNKALAHTGKLLLIFAILFSVGWLM